MPVTSLLGLTPFSLNGSLFALRDPGTRILIKTFGALRAVPKPQYKLLLLRNGGF